MRAKNATGNSATSDASDAATPTDETLAASSVTHNSATLTIGNYSGNWYYKANAAPHASCSSTAVSTTSTNLTGLSGNTSYTYKAYNNSGCTTELATASAFLTKPGKPAKPVATAGAGSGKLTLSSSVTGDGAISKWQYKKKESNTWDSDWSDISSTSTTLSYQVTGLTDGTSYTFKVVAVNATGDSAESAESDAAAPTDETLAASSVTHNSATLTIGNYTGNWYYQADTGPHSASCQGPVSAGGSAVDLSGLSPGTSYTYTAYSDSACSSQIARASQFTTPSGTMSFGNSTIADQSYTKDTAISTLTLPTATASPGSPTITYSLTPTLPAGLSFSATGRTISGTPTVAASSATYTYTAAATGYTSATLTFSLEALEPKTLSFGSTVADQSYTKGSAITTLTLPTATASTGSPTHHLHVDGEAALRLHLQRDEPHASAERLLRRQAALRTLSPLPPAAMNVENPVLRQYRSAGDRARTTAATETSAISYANPRRSPALRLSASRVTVAEGETLPSYTDSSWTAGPGRTLSFTTACHSGDVDVSGTLTAAALTFSANNWSTAQTVPLAATEVCVGIRLTA